MALILSEATANDAARIADIHMAAFGPNLMLRTQFPTAGVREGLRKTLELKAIADMKDDKTTVLVVRILKQTKRHKGDDESRYLDGQIKESNENIDGSSYSEVIAFAKWSHPVDADEEYNEPPWIWPEGTNYEVLNRWDDLLQEVQNRTMGKTPCYRMLRITHSRSFFASSYTTELYVNAVQNL